MLSWKQLVRRPDHELAKLDVADLNLACAEGLPGTERLDWRLCRTKLDDWAERCRDFTTRVMYGFQRDNGTESEAQYRVVAMVTHLQRDLGVRYHPQRIAPDAVFQPEDSFVYGIIQGDGGTCGSLPILYAAVGRRLGYPIKLAATRNHLFCRWDAGADGERFNIEGSGHGVSFFDDAHYRTGHYEMPAETIRACGYLESLTPREELASFLCQRGECWKQEKNYREAIDAYAWAHELDPRREQYRFLTAQTLDHWRKTLRSRIPSRHFPRLDIGMPARQFQRMPKEVEKEIIAQCIIEGFLDDRVMEAKWWSRLRARPSVRPTGLPKVFHVDFQWHEPGRRITSPV